VNDEDVKEEDDEEIGFSGFEIMKKIQELSLFFFLSFFLYKKYNLIINVLCTIHSDSNCVCRFLL
jgi:hypothetical protein